ncbi:hypothetical protein AB0M36_07115 [Actinoplanes sp. NPDC051346]|uniref:hypothetical protein n=1 Tax=Actinoplanes sp. NPDC051346 TaxID=3155048 RepID=UPI0034365879
MTLPTLALPIWAELTRGWSFVCGLPDGGMVVRDLAAERILLLGPGLEPTTTVAVPGLRAVAPDGIAVSPEAGLVAVAADDGLRVLDLAGVQRYRLTHPRWRMGGACAWTSGGSLLWTVTPTEVPGTVRVVAIDPTRWAPAGMVTVSAPSTNHACYAIVPDPLADRVGVLVLLADSDGAFLSWPRWDGATVVTGEPGPDALLTDVRGDGREYVAVLGGHPSELITVDLATQAPTGRLTMSAAAEADDTDDAWYFDAFYLAGGHLAAFTREEHLLLISSDPLRPVAELRLEGYRFAPFDGYATDTPQIAGPHLSGVRRWTDTRLAAMHSDAGTTVTRLYDLGDVAKSLGRIDSC